MLFRIVRRMKRATTSALQFVQRIPADIKPLAVGRTLHLQVTDDPLVPVLITAKSQSVRFSLRTSNAAEAKVRKAAALTKIWTALRASAPVNLTNRQATALAGRLYRAWASGEGRERTTVVQKTAHGFVVVPPDLGDEQNAFAAALDLPAKNSQNVRAIIPARICRNISRTFVLRPARLDPQRP